MVLALLSVSILSMPSFSQEKYSKKLQKAINTQLKLRSKPSIAKRDKLELTYIDISTKKVSEAGFAYMYCAEMFSFHSPEILRNYEKSFKMYSYANKLLTASTPFEKSASLYNIGLYYYKSLYVNRDLDSAFKYFEEAAVLDKKKGVGLGEIYKFGIGTEPNFYLSLAYYDAAVKSGNDVAWASFYDIEYIVNKIYEQKFDTIAYDSYRKGILSQSMDNDILAGKPFLLSSAERGFVPAQFELGTHYLLGHYSKDYMLNRKEAEKWLGEASKKNYAPALSNLGYFYEQMGNITYASNNKLGIEYIKKAYNSYLKAAELGFPMAQLNVGIYNQYGNSILPINYEVAYQWYAAAEKQGLKQATDRINQLNQIIKHERRMEIMNAVLSFIGATMNVANTIATTINKNQSNINNGYTAPRQNVSSGKAPASTNTVAKPKNECADLNVAHNKKVETYVYDQYVSELMNMKYGLGNYSKGYDPKKAAEFQQKMREIRLKWESKGCYFYKSAWESWNGK
jgi:TPR repeat protein